MTTKDDVIEMIRRLPDDATLDDMIYAISVRQRIEQGRREIAEGKGIPHEDVVKRISKRFE